MVKESEQGLSEGLYEALALTIYQQVREMFSCTWDSGSTYLQKVGRVAWDMH